MRHVYYHRPAADTFNSLSRDHGHHYGPRSRAEDPFNSLSRDHFSARALSSRESVFQLPLSGSPCTRMSSFIISTSTISTPSLGITKLYIGEVLPALGNVIYFNSLSRDHRARFRDFSALRGFLPRHLFAQMIPKTTIWIYRFAPL